MRWLLLLLAGCAAGPALDDRQAAMLQTLRLAPPPGDPSNAWADDPAAAQLGQQLFFDRRLSRSGQTACASCHQPENGFADPRRLSEEAGTTGRHAQAVVGAAWQAFFFWDGRCDTLWCQALQPIESDVEMAMTRVEVARVVAGDPALAAAYVDLFGPLPDLDDPRWPAAARPRPDTPDHPEALAWAALSSTDRDAIDRVFSDVGKALAAYERLLRPEETGLDAWIDAWNAGDAAARETALSPQEEEGLLLFVGDGHCTLCHFGPSLSSRAFQNIGLGMRDWLPGPDDGRSAGLPRLRADPFNAGGTYSDDPGWGAARIDVLVDAPHLLGAMKVPGLRGVASSAPYMHGGHFATLEDVVGFYDELPESAWSGHRGEELVPLGLEPEQRAALAAFLRSLDATVPAALAGP